MYCVYWMSAADENSDPIPHCQKFSELKEMLDFTAECRAAGAKFVASGYENPDMVGMQGVSPPPPNYEWFKRRDSLSAKRKDFNQNK